MEFNSLYNSHKDFVYNVVRKILRYKEDQVNDLCQDIWILIFTKLDQYDEKKGVIEGWLYRIASHQVFKFLNAKKESKEIYCLDNEEGNNIEMYYNFFNYSEAFKGEKEKEQKQKIELIKKESSKLARSAKEIFQLYHFEGMIHDEIAEFKGLSPNTSKSQLIRARARIKELIA